VAAPFDALRRILDAAGVDPEHATDVAITGADPVLPTPFRMAGAGAAALAAVGLAATALWRIRGGGAQEIAIDAHHAALAMRAITYLALEDGRRGDDWDPISGFYQGVDNRWIQLHCQFPHFRDGVLGLLGCSHDREAVAAAIAQRHAAELEDELAHNGLPGFMARTADEWAAHPQGQAVAALPLLEIIRIGDAPPEPLPMADRPLSGINVLDLTRVIAGPTVGRTLAEHGAEVLRISGPDLPFLEPLVIDTGHGKRAAEIDLGSADGRRQLEALVKDAAVFSQSYRPGALAARGFGPDDLAAIRPGIVCVSLDAWSHAGPWSERRGYDTLVQCATGLVDAQSANGAPEHLPGSPLDYLTGYLGAFGAMVALGRRAREGGSWHVRLSLAQTAHWFKQLGRVEGVGDPRDLPVPRPEDFGIERLRAATAWGPIQFLGPVLHMSETPPRWDRTARPLGGDAAAWPE